MLYTTVTGQYMDRNDSKEVYNVQSTLPRLMLGFSMANNSDSIITMC